MSDPLLTVHDLKTHFFTRKGVVRAVDGISFELQQGHTLGIVGESGSGKSISALSLVRLVPPPGRIVDGEIRFQGRDLLRLPEAEMRRVRGRGIGFIFQDPMTSLNPVLTVGEQIGESLAIHLGLRGQAARNRIRELLDLVGIPDSDKRIDQYPHEFSGGMRQRAMIAMALACDPALLIADEPTTALDVTIQAQILELLKRLQRELGMALILITHDLGVVAEICRDVMVMYAGRPAEHAPAAQLFGRPGHPYTQGLLQCRPRVRGGAGRLKAIPGMPPNLGQPILGCAFAPRCSYVEERCQAERPMLLPVEDAHAVACWVAQRGEVPLVVS